MSNSDSERIVDKLLEKALDGSITEEQGQLINTWILSDPAACRYYCEYMNLNVCIQRLTADISQADLLCNEDISLGTNIEIHPGRKKAGKTVKKSQFQVKKSKKYYFLLFNTAAIVMITLLLSFSSLFSENGAAILADSMNARWSQESSVPGIGKSFSDDGGSVVLLEGYAELLYNTNARVLIEAPADFQVIDNNELYLNYGKAFTVVPKEATGFTVRTNGAEIIDIGTVFGVMAHKSGITELHVIKGKTRLIVENNNGLYDQEITGGFAKIVSAGDKEISNIELNSDFVRDINSSENMLRRSQKLINLADLIGGGNGFGGGIINSGIDPSTAMKAQEKLVHHSSGNDFKPVRFNPYIDGIFIPNGDTEQIVSSKEDIFRECPKTNGMSYNNCIYAFRNIDAHSYNARYNSGEVRLRSLLMHANAGITFDLDAIRKTVRGESITSFKTILGIEENALRPAFINADFWILVDGQVRYSKRNVKDQKLHSVTVDLTENDRFLTLLTTDGGDSDERIYQGMELKSIDSDWCMFAEPVLIIE